MKTLYKLLTVFTATALFATGCVDDDPAYRKNPGENPGGGDLTGFVALGGMQMRVVLDAVTDTQPDDTGGETTYPKTSVRDTRTELDLSGYIVEILDNKGASVKKTTYGELTQTTTLTLPVGSYTLVARSQDQIPDTGWNSPVYVGTKDFAILKDKTTTIESLVCTLANIKVTLVVSADLAAKLSADTKASVTLGTKSEAFSMGETRAMYFMPDNEVNTLKFRLAGKFMETGSDVEFSKTISGVKAGQWRRITLVITYADKGNVKFDIKVDNFTLDDEITVDGTSSLGQWEPVYNEIDPTQPKLTWTDNNFDETLQLTAAMFDEEGRCSEPFELKLTAPNNVETFFVTIRSTNKDFSDALREFGIEGSFDLCALNDPTEPLYSLLKGFQFPVGDEVKGKTAKTFYIGGQLPSLLYNFEGTHTFNFNVTDANGLTVEKILSLLVDKQNEGPSIVWTGQDIHAKHDLVPGMAIDLMIKARSGVKAMEITIDSETLTPELGTLDPPLPAQFDLCTVSGATAVTLSGFGFPVGAEVTNRSEVSFSLTPFVGMLMLFKGEHDFIIKVTDNNGGVTQRTLQLVNSSN